MMTEGTLLYCDPFVFKNGATPKPKYFIVLADCFAFPRRTFVYGEQVDDYSEADLEAMNGKIQNLGVLKSELLADLKGCIKQATNIKRKYLKWL